MKEYPISPREYLTQKNIPYKESNGEFQMQCLFGVCDQNTNHPGHLYMSIENGTYNCKKCGEKGNLWTLAKHFGDKPKDFAGIPKQQKEQKINAPTLLDDQTVEKYHKALPDRIRQWLIKERGISESIIDERKIGYGTFYKKKWVVFPIQIDGGWFLKLRKDPEDTENEIKHKVFPAGNQATLLGKEMLDGSDYVILCEGELDMFVLESHGLIAATSTGGAGTFKPEWCDLIKTKEIIVCYDNDEKGEKGAERTLGILAERIKDSKLFQIKLPPEVGDKGDVTDFFVRLGKSVDDFMTLKKIHEPILKDNENNAGQKIRKSMADKLIELIEESGAELFQDEFKEPMARIAVKNHYETYSTRSRHFRRWLSSLYWKSYGKAINGDAIKNALGIIEAKACFEGDTHKLENRLALHDEDFWYDLSNDEWQALKINRDGWEIVPQPPIIFRRYSHQKAQVMPIQGGNVRKLLDFFSFNDANHECLFLVMLVSFFIPGIGHPIPILFGPQGSAKTTRSRMVKRIVDPSSLWVLSFPSDSAQLIQILSHHHVAFFDNISYLPDWASDILCRAVTGEGTSKRQLYTDDEDIIYVFRRCVGLNGINIAANKADLLDRSILFGLERIASSNRKTDTELWASFEEELPSILGGILDTLVKAMQILPSVTLQNFPRMADFAKWGVAIAQALGYAKDEFINSYNANITAQNDEVLEGTPVATAILAFMADKDEWEGSASGLLKELRALAENDHIDVRASKWPKAANILTRRINEVKPNLMEAGLNIEYIKDTVGNKRGRYIKITKNIVATDATVLPSDAEPSRSDDSDGSDDISSSFHNS